MWSTLQSPGQPFAVSRCTRYARDSSGDTNIDPAVDPRSDAPAVAVSNGFPGHDSFADRVAYANCASNTAGNTEPDTDPETHGLTNANFDGVAVPARLAIVTFKVVNQEYRVLVTDPANVLIAQQLLAGEDGPHIPNGIVVRGDPSVNIGWSWHIDPATFEFADATTEVCDGKPSYVENDKITSDYYCPWSAEVIAVEAANR